MSQESATAPSSPATLRRPRRWVAALLTLLSPGLGHLYAGRWRLALAIGGCWLLMPLLFALGLRGGLASLVAAGGAYLAAFVGVVGHAVRAAGRAPERSGGGGLRALSGLAFLAASWAASAGENALLQRHVARTFVVSSAAMAPTLAVGDLVVVVPGGRAERGAVVAHAPPPRSGRPDPLLKRVAGMGGDVVAVEDGALLVGGRAVERRPDGGAAVEERPEGGEWRISLAARFLERNGGRAYHTLCTPERACGDAPPTAVPPGQLYLLGDNRDHSADSRVYGPIPEASVLGRVRHVYWSSGPRGVRWSRIGMPVE